MFCFPGDVLNGTQNVQNAALLARDSSVSCHTRCESVVHCHSAPLSESGVRLLGVHVKARWMSELSSRLPKALLSESLPYPQLRLRRPAAPGQFQWLAICPRQPNIFLTSNDDDVWSIFEAGFLSLIPSPLQIDAKRREKRWLCTRSRRSSFCREKEWPLKRFSSS